MTDVAVPVVSIDTNSGVRSIALQQSVGVVCGTIVRHNELPIREVLLQETLREKGYVLFVVVTRCTDGNCRLLVGWPHKSAVCMISSNREIALEGLKRTKFSVALHIFFSRSSGCLSMSSKTCASDSGFPASNR